MSDLWVRTGRALGGLHAVVMTMRPEVAIELAKTLAEIGDKRERIWPHTAAGLLFDALSEIAKEEKEGAE
jgi:hypothetical protein